MTKINFHKALKKAYFAKLLGIGSAAFTHKEKGTGSNQFSIEQRKRIAEEFGKIRCFLDNEESKIMKGIAREIAESGHSHSKLNRNVEYENMRKAVDKLGDAWEKINNEEK